MGSLSITTLLLLLAIPDPLPQDPPRELELFARESWYQEQKGPLQDFVGVLGKIQRAKGVVGFNRFNPFYLQMEDNKVREVYVGSKPELLEPYIGKKIKLTGKAVDMNVEGREHHEIWPARLSVCMEDKKNVGEKGGIRIYSKTPARLVANTCVLRSGAELARASNREEKQMSMELARLLKLDSIDWDHHMVIIIAGGTQRTGGYSVEVQALEISMKKLVVRWKLNTPTAGSFVTQALTHPTLTLLVDRFDGEVEFEPKLPLPKQ